MSDQVEEVAREVGVRVDDADAADELVVHHLVVGKGSDPGSQQSDEGLVDGDGEVHVEIF